MTLIRLLFSGILNNYYGFTLSNFSFYQKKLYAKPIKRNKNIKRLAHEIQSLLWNNKDNTIRFFDIRIL